MLAQYYPDYCPNGVITLLLSLVMCCQPVAFFRLTFCGHLMVILLISLGSWHSVKAQQIKPLTWEEAKQKKSGELTVFWFESRPFIFRQHDRLVGMEYEIMKRFVEYLNRHHDMKLTVKFVEGEGFADVLNRISRHGIDGTFGASAFSRTPEREAQVMFSPSYLLDISVLISSKNVPIVTSEEEFKQVFSRLTAVTIHGTTYEKDLLKLKEEKQMNFPLTYINSANNILREIEKRDSAFGFIDLPVYMMLFNENSSINVERQNLFPIRRSGYGIIMPKNSSWAEPIREYFESPQFKQDLRESTPNYFDSEIYQFLEDLAIRSSDPVVLLNKEKDIQSRDLLEKTKRIETETRLRNFLAGLMALSLLLIAFIVYLMNRRLVQNREIEAQRQRIEDKSQQLEKRNEHLVQLNEEKNNLVRILAHDLRTPINQVQGLAQLLTLSTTPLSGEQQEIVGRIKDSSTRLTKMITNILDTDSLDNDRVQVFLEKVCLNDLLQQVLKSFQKQAAAKSIALTFQDADTRLYIQADPLFLTQVIENLLSNALKFSEAGKSIEAFMEVNGAFVRAIVQDHGPGVLPEDMSNLFKKFSKLSARPTGGESSTGLGLSIVKKYTELMGGSVWCESEPGKVTRFIVEFSLTSA